MEGKCNKHWSHKQSKGVCPDCLREKLEQITAYSSSSKTNLSSSMASLAAFSSSSNESPRLRRPSRKTLLHLFKGGKDEEPLRRSSSVAFEVEERKEKKKKKIKKISKKSGGSTIWAMFMFDGEGRKKGREVEGLYHSKTVKENKSSSKWPFHYV